MPAFSYNLDIKTQNGNETLITMIMIDTIILCGNLAAIGGQNQPKLSSRKGKETSDMYFADLEKRLAQVAATSVPYILVSGHFPVWSVGKHGPTECLVDRLRPLLHKYNVSAYFSGHDHNVQHLRDTYENRTVDYIVSGNSAFNEHGTPYEKAVPRKSLKFHWVDYWRFINGAFVLAETAREHLTLTFFETNGKPLYKTLIKPRF